MADWLDTRESREPLLHIANVLQQRKIKSGIDFLEMMADSIRRTGVRRQALMVLPARYMSCVHEPLRAAWLTV